MVRKKSAKTVGVQVDSKLLRKVMKRTGHRSERRVVETGLRMLIGMFEHMKAVSVRAEQDLDQAIAYCDASNERIEKIDKKKRKGNWLLLSWEKRPPRRPHKDCP